MERAIRAYVRIAADRFAGGLTAAAAEPERWQLPLPHEIVDEYQLQVDLDNLADDHYASAADTTTSHMRAELGIDFDLSNRLLEGVIARQKGMKITTAPADLINVLMRSLQESYDAGDSIPRAARKMRATGYTHAKGYAERIARTEIISATNAASLAQVRGGTTITYKLWQATNDSRTRNSHRDADNQTVKISEAFQVGGHSLDYPGDPAGPADEVIQCRCTLGYVDEPITASGGTVSAVDTTEEAIGASWAGPMVFEGVETGDGRRIEPGALKWRAMPLTLMGQKTTPEWGGHAEAAVSGRIDSLTRSKGSAEKGDPIDGTGVFDTGDWGSEIERMVRDGMLKGVSVDLAVNDAEIIPDPDIEDEIEAWFMGTLNILDAVVLGATVVPFPAFENANIAIVASAGPVEFIAATDGGRGKRIVRNFTCSIFTPFEPTLTAERDPQFDKIDAMIDEISDVVKSYPDLSVTLSVAAQTRVPLLGERPRVGFSHEIRT